MQTNVARPQLLERFGGIGHTSDARIVVGQKLLDAFPLTRVVSDDQSTRRAGSARTSLPVA